MNGMARGMYCLARWSSAALRIALLSGFATVFGMSIAAEAAIVVHTADFISDALRTNFNGFEAIPWVGLGTDRHFTGGAGPYIEDGVRVQQVNGDPGNDIWVGANSYWGGQGQNSWYPDSGDHGFTRISMVDGSDFQNVGFLRGSGGPTPSLLFYDLYKNGVLVLSGSVSHTSNSQSQYLGFSGGGFDQIDLRDNSFPGGNALAIDSIEVMRTAVPELNVTKSGTGTGTVTSNVGGINCGATCSTNLAAGSIVTLAATPTGSSTFAGWSGGGCSGTGACVVTVDAAKTVNAQFNGAPATFPLNVTKSGTGTGTVTSNVGGINCGATCSTNLAAGSIVTLAATPTGSSTFAGWSGDCTGFGTQSTCTLGMNAARGVIATFSYVGAGSEYSRDYVQKAYMAYYGRPADPEGQSYWAWRMDAEGGSLNAIIGAFGYSDEFNRRYGGLGYRDLVTLIYQQALGRDPDQGGLDWYVAELEAGRRTLQTITLDVLNGATTAPDSTVVANKLDVAAYYTAKVVAGCPYGTEQDGVDVITIVTALPASVTGAKTAIDAGCGP